MNWRCARKAPPPARASRRRASSTDLPRPLRQRRPVQRFDGRHGGEGEPQRAFRPPRGDLQGYIDHLDYIADLGATAIWSSPLLLDNQAEESFHGCACGDCYKIDLRFGSNELFKEYVAKAHGKGLKVIMDIVTYHCGTAHWWMQDLPFRDWIHQFPEYTGSNFTFSTLMDPNASVYDRNRMESGRMPDMNLDNPFVLRYFQQWAIWWAEYSGLDGFGVDTYPYNEKVPMSQWCAAVMREYPDFNIVGECWDSQFDQLAYWQTGHPNADAWHQDPAKMKIAYTLLATVRGIPQLFYGDEMMFATGENYKSDGELRMDFPVGFRGICRRRAAARPGAEALPVAQG